MAVSKFFNWIKRGFMKDSSLEAVTSDKRPEDERESTVDNEVPSSTVRHDTEKPSYRPEASAKPAGKSDQDASLSHKGRDVSHLSKKGRTKQISKREKKLINIGIDFGTSSTKIIYRDQVAGKAWIQTFQENPKQYPPVVYPSAVRITGDKLYFGSSVEESKGGLVLRSFKVCMACQSGHVSSDECNLHYESSVHPEPGLFQFASGTSRLDISACELGTYYLAHVIGLAKRSVYGRFSKDFDVGLTYNMCIPVDYQDDDQTSTAFQRALFLAHCLSDIAGNGCDLDVLHAAYKDLDKKYQEIPSDEVRTTFIQPESIAAVMSYALSRVADEGLYAIVDVGAGTTDVSFFRLADLPDRRLAVYSARSHTVGGNAIDSAVLDHLAECDAIPHASRAQYTDRLRQQIKLLKEQISPRKPMPVRTKEGITNIEYESFQNIAEPVVSRVFSSYRKTFGQAYKKENMESRWRTYSLFLIGGCSKLKVMSDSLTEKPWDRIGAIARIPLPLPTNLRMDKGDDGKIEGLFFLLTVAYGLSFHPAEYPRIIAPSGLPPLTPSAPVREEDDSAPWGPVYPDTK